jgi:hypothetical protein
MMTLGSLATSPSRRGVVPNLEGPLFYVVLLWYFSTGAQYGALQEPNYTPNAEFVQLVLEATSIQTHTSQRLSHL